MLPKVDKKHPSKNPDSEQLELKETIPDSQKLARKRKTLITLLLVSIGLSLIFWLYKTFSVSRPSFPAFNFPSSVPKISVTGQSTLVLNSDLKKILKDNPQILTLYLVSTNPDTSALYGSEITDFADLQNQLKDIAPKITTADQSLLPQGINFRELKFAPYYAVLVSTPSRDLYIVIRSENLDDLTPIYPQVISAAYWSVFGN